MVRICSEIFTGEEFTLTRTVDCCNERSRFKKLDLSCLLWFKTWMGEDTIPNLFIGSKALDVEVLFDIPLN